MNVVDCVENDLSVILWQFTLESNQNFCQICESSVYWGSHKSQITDLMQYLFNWSVECPFTILVNRLDLKLFKSALIVFDSESFVLDLSVPIQVTIRKGLRQFVIISFRESFEDTPFCEFRILEEVRSELTFRFHGEEINRAWYQTFELTGVS
jgi:hypothetical protein